MGNQESTYDDSDEEVRRQQSSYAESSIDNSHLFQPASERNDNFNSSYAQSSTRSSYHPQKQASHTTDSSNSSYAKSSNVNNHLPMGQSSYIADNFHSLDEVTCALREAGLESSNLILGIDFTKSNEWTGRHSFGHKSLHAIGSKPNPYEQAINIIGRTLSPFDDDNLIPCFGFGDASTHDNSVFSFFAEDRCCRGFEEALARYREIVPYIKLSGPTSFAPIIDAAIDVVERNNKQYHVLVIIADGQVTRGPDLPAGRFSPQEQATLDSIVTASQYPLSIIVVGVGDGPWDAMQLFDDRIPQRKFDNFQFVNFTKIMCENREESEKDASFALSALMEIPFQYRATQSLRLYDKNLGDGLRRKQPFPPPREVLEHDKALKSIPHMAAFQQLEHTIPDELACPICLTNPRNMAFACGHTTCEDCSKTISLCPLCRKPVTTRLKLYT